MESCRPHVTDSSSPAEDSFSTISCISENELRNQIPSAEVPPVAPVPLKSIMKAPSLAQKRARTASKIQGWWKNNQKINISEQQKVLAAKKAPEASTTRIESKVTAVAKVPIVAAADCVAAETVQPTRTVKGAKKIEKVESAVEESPRMSSKAKSVTTEPVILKVNPLPIAPSVDVTPVKAATPDESQNSSARTKKRVAAKSIASATLDLALIDQLIQEVPFYDDRFSKVPRKASSRPPTEVSIPTSIHTPQPPPLSVPKKVVAKAKRKSNGVSDPVKPKAKKRKPKENFEAIAAESTEEAVQVAKGSAAPENAPSKAASKEKSSNNTDSNEELRRKRNPQVFEGVPDDAVAFDIDWGSGWMKRGFERSSGASKAHIDYYWYTPKRQYKLRSLKEVERFVNFCNANGQDEALAHRLLRSK